MQDQKMQLRKQFRQYRDDIDAITRSRNNLAILEKLQGLPEITAANSLFCYISTGTETDTRLLLEWLLNQGKQLAVPKINGSGRMLAVPFTGWTGLQTGTHGIPAPVSSEEFIGKLDVCITPGLVFTSNGIRLGQGQGYYDHWFAEHTVRHKIALAFECQITGNLPADTHDIVVDMIITEQRIIRVS